MKFTITPIMITIILVTVLFTSVMTFTIYSINLYIRDINNQILEDVKTIATNILSNQTSDRESENQNRVAANESRDLILEGLQNKENITNR